jgi:hypothetical protein
VSVDDEEDEACAWTVELADPFIVEDKFIAVDIVKVDDESLLDWLTDVFNWLLFRARNIVRRGLLLSVNKADVDWVIRVGLDTSTIDCIVEAVNARFVLPLDVLSEVRSPISPGDTKEIK